MDLYGIARIVCLIVTRIIFRPKITGIENIPKDGGFIMAANHTSMFDPVVMLTTTKRRVHFLAKSEIFKFPQGIIFGHMGLIRVLRDINGKEALNEAIDYLKDGHIIGIFPEGTRERGRGLLSFKYGTVKMAKETNTPIIPIGITGKYKLFNSKLVFNIGKPIYIKDNLNIENKKLRDSIKKLL